MTHFVPIDGPFGPVFVVALHPDMFNDLHLTPRERWKMEDRARRIERRKLDGLALAAKEIWDQVGQSTKLEGMK